MSPFAQSTHSLPGDSSSIMSVVNTDDGHIGDESFYFQTVAGDEEVTDRWINSKRRQSITKETSHSLLTDIEEGHTEVDSYFRKTAASIVKQVTERVLSSHEVFLKAGVQCPFLPSVNVEYPVLKAPG
ncbi:hypothetical protein P5673_023519 [Acropora cervicornis]|uniref:Uncharacterized protein n=1 Tax=Acropora cervicornis TaxID=6130 RepID=A0AAD9UYQ6_ACRCE|nr:hypothetical protein P5673_023519 [Acropora cervicornis]